MQLTNSISAVYSIFFAIILATGSATSQVIYVSEGATGDGSSWQNATGDLRSALSSAQDGDELWVSEGTYTPTLCSPCSFADRDMRFVLPKGVKLMGGFSGTEVTAEDRFINDPTSVALVTLSGDISTGVDTSRSFTVLEAVAPTTENRIEFITFESGLANDETRGNSSRGASGALLYITSYDTLEHIDLSLDYCTFLDGQAIGYGGAIFVDADSRKNSQLQFSNCDFGLNSAETGGGAITLTANSGGYDNSTFFNCNFDANEAGQEGGGGILIRAANGGRSEAQFDGVNFSGNRTTDGDGGGLRLYGNNGYCSPTISNATFDGNFGHFGGALQIDGGFGGVSSPILTNCELYENESGNAGGAIFANAIFGGTCDFEIYQSKIYANYSGESGGAILVNAIEGSSRAHYRDVQFTDNEAFYYGGAVYNLGKGGVCSPTFINCIIANNKGASAGGVYCLGSEGGESSPIILNCVFEGNEALVGGGLYSNGNDSTGTAEPFVANTVFLNNRADNGRTLRIIHAKPRLLNCYFDEVDCASLNSGFGGEPICLGGNQYNTADVFDRTKEQYAYQALMNAPILDAGNDSILIAHLIFNDHVGDVRYRGTATDLGPNERSSDPLLLEIKTDSLMYTACEGSETTLNAQLNPPYPTAEITWTVGGMIVNQGQSYTIQSVDQSQTIQIEASVSGETNTMEVTVVALPVIQTSLTIDTSTLTDKLCIDSIYQISATCLAPGADCSVVWFDEDENILAQSGSLSLQPANVENIMIRAEASFTGACLDEISKEETLSFEVVNCETSSTRQPISNEPIIAYPNPTHGNISLQGLPENSRLPLKIYSSTGQIVYSGIMSASERTVDLSPLPQGLYFIIINDEQTIFRVLLEKL